MKACGIITEYNPLHNGHLYHLQKAKEITQCDIIINVMSGNFVQRGEPAICDKWQRAKEAILHGCDIVIELPLPYAIQSAKQFAYGAVESLKLAKVDCIVFGSETNDQKTLTKIASLNTDAFKSLLKEGLSPAKAYEMIHGRLYANDILGIHYLQALAGTDIIPYTIKRIGDYHDEILPKDESHIVSATAIRSAIAKNADVSCFTPMHFTPHASLDASYPLIRHMLLTTDPHSLQEFILVDEGIENWLIKHAKSCDDFQSFMKAAINKRYTASRIRRVLLHLLLQIKQSSYPIDHIRILAFNNKGKTWLKQIKEDTKIATKFMQIPVHYRTLYEKGAYLYAQSEPDFQSCYKSEWQSALYLNK